MFIENFNCKCVLVNENPKHYFLYCPIHETARLNLLECISTLGARVDLNILLYGEPEMDKETDIKIIKTAHTFNLETKRF